MSDTALTPRIVGERRIVKIGLIRPNTFNYNKQSAFIYDKMLSSLKEFGFVDPIDVRSGDDDGAFEDGHFEVIGGEHRLKAAQEVGYEEVPVNDLGDIPDAQAKKLCIVLNETKGKPDNEALAVLIAELSTDGVDLAVLPYDESEIDAFIELTSDSLDDLSSIGGDDGNDNSSVRPTKETIISVMGLLDISANKEAFLITQFKQVQNVMSREDNPIRCLEKMMEKVIEGS